MEMKEMYIRPLIEVVAITPENGVCDAGVMIGSGSADASDAPGRKDFGSTEVEDMNAMQRGSSFELDNAEMNRQSFSAWE